MGMFDTFHIQHRARQFAVQSEQFSCQLVGYLLGDIASFEQYTATDVTVWIEEFKAGLPARYAVAKEMEKCHGQRGTGEGD